MNYSAMIQNRRSVRAFREKEVPSEATVPSAACTAVRATVQT